MSGTLSATRGLIQKDLPETPKSVRDCVKTGTGTLASSVSVAPQWSVAEPFRIIRKLLRENLGYPARSNALRPGRPRGELDTLPRLLRQMLEQCLRGLLFLHALAILLVLVLSHLLTALLNQARHRHLQPLFH